MRICLVMPEYLPVPAVSGGAVETLTEEIIRYNEIHKELELDCVTKYDKNAIKEFSKYPNTTFKTIHFFTNKYFSIFYSALNFLFKKFLKVDIRKKIRSKAYIKRIKENEYDLVVFEGANNYITEELVNKIGKDKMVLHLHKVHKPNKSWAESFGNFISISEYVKNEFCSDDEVSENRVFTVLNGIDLQKFKKDFNNEELTNLKLKLGINNNEKVILYTGRLLPEKGVKELIEAFKSVKQKENCKLIIVGSVISNSNTETKYTKQLKDLAEKENIIFTGYIQNSELYKYYKIADFAVFPSTGPEGLGLVVLEAMASGLATIITNSGGMPEIVSKETSLIVDLDKDMVENLTKSMQELITDDKCRGEMAESALKLVEKFSSENYYNKFVQALRKIKE